MTADTVGGIWTYAGDLATGLAERGLDVTLAVVGPFLRPDQLAPLHPGITVVDTGLELDWLAPDERSLGAAGRDLARTARQFGADIVHLNSPSYAADAPFDMPVLGMCHSCSATWWDAVRGGELPAGWRWRSEMLARGYAACDVLIAPSLSFAAATEARYGVSPQTVLNGRSAWSHPQPAKQPYVLTSGRLWDAGKNIQALDCVAGLMRGEVHAAGPLQGPDGVQVTLRNIHSLGTLDATAMADCTGRAAVFASLARYEPFGLGVLEAAQAGCALVLSDIPTFRELWSDVAVFVDPDDPARLAMVLDGLLDDAAEATRLGHQAAMRAQRYTVDRMVESTIAVYRGLNRAVQSVGALA